jgi:ATP-dependent Clp protease ATP-binding subunit ClpX
MNPSPNSSNFDSASLEQSHEDLPPLKPSRRIHDPDGRVAKMLLKDMARVGIGGENAFRMLAAYNEGMTLKALEGVISFLQRYELPTSHTGLKPDPESEFSRIAFWLKLWDGRVAGHIDQHHYMPSPAGIAAGLNSLVLGQEESVGVLADALYWQKLAHHLALEASPKADADHPVLQMRRGPILIHGATGCGKTFLVQTAAKLMGLPFVHVDSSSLVGEGIVGNSLSDVCKSLARKVDDGDNSARFTLVFFDEVDKLLQSEKFSGLQAEFLRVLEGGPCALSSHARESRQVEAGQTFDTSQLLIILGGAFQNLEDNARADERSIGFDLERGSNRSLPPDKQSLLNGGGIGREFYGRLRAVTRMRPLDEQALMAILDNEFTSPLCVQNARMSLFGAKMFLSKNAKRILARNAASQSLGARPLEQTIARVAGALERRLISSKPRHGEVETIRVGAKNILAALDHS